MKLAEDGVKRLNFRTRYTIYLASGQMAIVHASEQHEDGESVTFTFANREVGRFKKECVVGITILE